MEYDNEYNLPPRPASPSLLLGYNRPITPPPPTPLNAENLKKTEPEIIELNDSDSDDEIKIEHVNIKIEKSDSDEEIEYIGYKPIKENTTIPPPKKKQRVIETDAETSTEKRTNLDQSEQHEAEISSSTEEPMSSTPATANVMMNMESLQIESINGTGRSLESAPNTCSPSPVSPHVSSSCFMSPKQKNSSTLVIPELPISLSNCIPTNDDWDKGMTWDDPVSNDPNVEPSSGTINDSRQPSSVQTSNFQTASVSQANIVKHGQANIENTPSTFKVPTVPSTPPLRQLSTGNSGKEEIIHYDGEYVKRYALVETSKATTNNPPEKVSHCVQTGESIINGEPMCKRVEDVTRPTVSQYQTDASTQKSTSSSTVSKDNREEATYNKEKDKDRRRRSSTSSSRSHSRDSHRHRHRSKDDKDSRDRRHDRYMQESNKRNRVSDREQKTVPPRTLFTTAEELIMVIRTCQECIIQFPTRSHAVNHHKKEHNKKYCPVCYQLLTIKGNVWKDHLTKFHARSDEELANCPLCEKAFNFEGIYQHICRVHLMPVEITGITDGSYSPETPEDPPVLSREHVINISDLLPRSSPLRPANSGGSNSLAAIGHQVVTSKTKNQTKVSNKLDKDKSSDNLPSTSKKTRRKPRTSTGTTVIITTSKGHSISCPSGTPSHISGSNSKSSKTSEHKSTSPAIPNPPSSALTTFVAGPSRNNDSSKLQPSPQKPSSSTPASMSENKGLEFSADQMVALLKLYKKNRTPNGHELLNIAEKLKANFGSVKDWFMKKYMKDCEKEALFTSKRS